MYPVAVVLVNDNPQTPARQRPVAQALDNVGSPVVAEYACRYAWVRSLAGTHSRGHTEALKEKENVYIQGGIGREREKSDSWRTLPSEPARQAR